MPKPANWLEDFSSVYIWTGADIRQCSVKYLSSSPMTTFKLKKKPDLPTHTKQIQWEQSKSKHHTLFSLIFIWLSKETIMQKLGWVDLD